MSYIVTIRTNAAQATDVVIRDVGVVILAGGLSVTFSDEVTLQLLSMSANTRALATDDAFGPGSSTLIINDGVNDVPQADVEVFLSNVRVDVDSGPYGLLGNDDSGSPLAQPDIVRPYVGALALRDTVYQRADGAVSQADASALATMPVLGFVSELDVPAVGSCKIRSLGDLGGFAGLTPKSIYIAGTAPGTIVADDDTGNPNYPVTTPGSGNIIQEVGQAQSASVLFVGTNRDFQEID